MTGTAPRGTGGISRLVLAVLFTASGILHFIATDYYAATIPRWLPAPVTLVWISGVAEIAGGLGLLYAPVRKAAGWGLLLLLLAVWPANFQMLGDARAEGASVVIQTALLIRLPLQLALAWWVWRAARLHLPGRPRKRDLGIRP